MTATSEAIDWTTLVDEARAASRAKMAEAQRVLGILVHGRRRLGERSDTQWCAWCGGLAQEGSVEVSDCIGRFVGVVHYDGCLPQTGLKEAFDTGNDGAAVWSTAAIQAWM